MDNKTEKTNLKDFLLGYGFVERKGITGTKYTYGLPWTSKYINDEIYPLVMFQTNKGSWFCHLLGMTLPTIPEPQELIIILEQLKSYGVK